MNKGICTVAVAPLRAEASHQSEMTSQLLYGETFEIIENGQKFSRIKMDFDGYEGWADLQQFKPIEQQEYQQKNTEILTNVFTQIETPLGNFLLSAGSEVHGETQDYTPQELCSNIDETAKCFLNVPYLWSGRSFFGIDCSGFVQLVYKLHGMQLPREAKDQAKVGEVLSFIEEAQPGDLAFFENADGEIVHVGIILEDQRIIHAFGKVRIDFLDSAGIFNTELNKHTHKLRFLRTLK